MRAGMLIAALLVSGCATVATTRGAPTAEVRARGETVAVATANADAADDPAIWRNAADPGASLIVGTDKKAGLYVYDLDGRQRNYLAAGDVNNVDLRDGVAFADGTGVLVAASDRTDRTRAAVALFRLDTVAGRLVPLGRVAAGPGEAYGMCLGRINGALYGFVVLKDGTVEQLSLEVSRAQPTGAVVRRMKLGTQSEGCVVDEARGRLFVAEEDVGIWSFDAQPQGSTAPVSVAKVDGRTLVADVEGLALAGDYLVASSQGDSAYAVYRIADHRYMGRFRIAPGTVDGTSETDGIEIARGDFGPRFPHGLMVAQDGNNSPQAQNFKLVGWDDIAAALGLAR